MEIRNDIFRAIADPTRREIITMVARQPLNLNAIADNFDVTRQAVSLHVKILNDCGLILIRKKGRERYCEAQLAKLDEVSEWVTQSKKIWTSKFKSLDNFLEDLQNKNKPSAAAVKKKTNVKRK